MDVSVTYQVLSSMRRNILGGALGPQVHSVECKCCIGRSHNHRRVKLMESNNTLSVAVRTSFAPVNFLFCAN